MNNTCAYAANITECVINLEEYVIDRKEIILSNLMAWTIKDDTSELLKTATLAIKCMQFYDVETINSNIFQFLIPLLQSVIKNSYVLNVENQNSFENIRLNLQLVLQALHLSLEIIDYLLAQNDTNANSISYALCGFGEIIMYNFQHCSNSNSIYKEKFSALTELLTLFKCTQQLHTKYLSWIDLNLVFNLFNESHIKLIQDVFETIYTIAEVLPNLNAKSMVDNWKYFIKYMKKFSSIQNHINTTVPLRILTVEIKRNFEKISPIKIDNSLQTVKIIGLLIKAFVQFWGNDDKNLIPCSEDMLVVLIIIYGFSVEYYAFFNYPIEICNLIQKLVFDVTFPILEKVSSNGNFLQIFIQFASRRDKIINQYPEAFLYLTNLILQTYFSINPEESLPILRFDILFETIYNCIKKCDLNFYYFGGKFYDELVQNLYHIALQYHQYYAQIEQILLNCILQCNYWSAIVAIDTWTLIMRTVSSELVTSTIHSLCELYKELQLDLFTLQPELVYLKMLLQRILNSRSICINNEDLIYVQLIEPIRLQRSEPQTHLYNEQQFTLQSISIPNVTSYEDLNVMIKKLDFIPFSKLVTMDDVVKWILDIWNFTGEQENPLLKYFFQKIYCLLLQVDSGLTIRDSWTILDHFKQHTALSPLGSCHVLYILSKCKSKRENNCEILRPVINKYCSKTYFEHNPVVFQTGLDILHTINLVGSSMEPQEYYYSDNKTELSESQQYQFLKALNAYQFKHSYVDWPIFKIEHVVPMVESNYDRNMDEEQREESNESTSEIDLVLYDLKQNVHRLQKVLRKESLNVKQGTQLQTVIKNLNCFLN